MDLMQKVAEVAPEKFNFLFKEAAEEIKASPFKDEIVQDMDFIVKTAEELFVSMAKEAGVENFDLNSLGAAAKAAPGFASGMGKAFGSAMGHPLPLYIGSTIAAGIATSLAGDLYEAARRGLTKSRHYSAMLELNPDLADRAREDPSVKVMFNTLHRFNPEFSGDPHTAGSYVRTQLEYPNELTFARDLVAARKNIRDAQQFRVPSGVPVRTKQDIEAQKAQMQSNQAQGFKTRQEGQRAYNERMGMQPADRGRKSDR
jgi:hypothetical protein